MMNPYDTAGTTEKRKRTKQEVQAHKAAEKEYKEKVERLKQVCKTYSMFCDCGNTRRRKRHEILVHPSGAVFFAGHGLLSVGGMVAEYELKHSSWSGATGCWGVAAFLRDPDDLDWREQKLMSRYIGDPETRRWLRALGNKKSGRTSMREVLRRLDGWWDFQEKWHYRMKAVILHRQQRIADEVDAIVVRYKISKYRREYPDAPVPPMRKENLAHAYLDNPHIL